MLCLAATAPAHAAESRTILLQDLPLPGRRELRVALLPLRLAYRLPDSFLAADGDSVWLSGRALVPNRDYVLERAMGVLRLIAPFEAGDTLRLVYRVLPVSLQPVYGERPQWQSPPAAGEEVPVAVAAAPASTSTAREASALPPPRLGGTPSQEAPELRLSGNKSVSVEFGSGRDAALRQSLDLATTGRLGAQTTLVAQLSDRNAALSDEGGTLQLSDFDKVLVEVRSPRATATLGDYTLDHGRGFGVLSRELTGARGLWSSPVGTAQGAVGVAKGRYRSLEFVGEDGRQGPYLLTDESGATGVPVVANSEVVRVDGERMTRGEAADYSMDYDRGRLTFSSRRPISRSSRIAVDYQIGGAPYRRTSEALAGAVRRGGLEVFGHAYREADDPGHPTSGFLSTDDVATLVAAGDSASKALGSGVSAGPGDYDAVVDSSGASHYAFAGRDSGDFRVEFAAVGSGRGQYAESTQVAGVPIYHFVGPGLGTHLPGRALALPGEQAIVGGGAAYHWGDRFHVEGEVASSRRDANRLSAIDDAADRGTAGQASLGATSALRLGDRDLGSLLLDASFRRLDRRFVSAGRVDSAFYQEDWGASVGRDLAGREQRAASLRYRPRSSIEVGGERARLTTPDGYRADRWRATGSWEGVIAQKLRFDRVESSDTTSSASLPGQGHRDKLWYEARWTRGRWFLPAFRLDSDERVSPGEPESTSLRYRAWDASARGTASIVQWTSGFEFRRDFRTSESGWTTSRTSRALRVSLVGSPIGSWGWNAGGSRQWLEGASGKNHVDNGYARLRQGTPGSRLSQDVAAEWTAEATVHRTREITFVGSGAGGYDSLGNFVGRGDYDVRLVEDPTTLLPLVHASLSYRLETWPWSSATGAGTVSGTGSSPWRQVRLSSLLQTASGRRGSLSWADFLAAPGRLRDRADVLSGTFLWRVEAEQAQTEPISILLRAERRAAADRQFEGSSTVENSWNEEGRLRARAGRRWLAEASLSGAQREVEQSVPSGSSQARRLEEITSSLEATYVRDEHTRLSAVGEIDRVRARGEPVSVIARIGPRARYAMGNRVSLEALVRWAAIQGDRVPTLLPNGFPLRPDRFDFRADASYRVRERANLTLTWTGHAPKGERLVHTALAELRTFF